MGRAPHSEPWYQFALNCRLKRLTLFALAVVSVLKHFKFPKVSELKQRRREQSAWIRGSI